MRVPTSNGDVNPVHLGAGGRDSRDWPPIAIAVVGYVGSEPVGRPRTLVTQVPVFGGVVELAVFCSTSVRSRSQSTGRIAAPTPAERSNVTTSRTTRRLTARLVDRRNGLPSSPRTLPDLLALPQQ